MIKSCVIAIAAGEVLLAASPSMAETITLECVADPATGAALTATYEGDSSGNLTVTGAYGEFRLPAKLRRREEVDKDGKPQIASGISADGTANVVMPDRALLEACVAKATQSQVFAGMDVASVALNRCLESAPSGAAAAAVSATVAIGAGPEVIALFSRTFVEPIKFVTDPVRIIAMPACTVAK